jgi:hypothetical protein
MVLANVDGIESLEMVGLIDFLTESRAGLVSLLPRKDEGQGWNSQRT